MNRIKTGIGLITWGTKGGSQVFFSNKEVSEEEINLRNTRKDIRSDLSMTSPNIKFFSINKREKDNIYSIYKSIKDRLGRPGFMAISLFVPHRINPEKKNNFYDLLNDLLSIYEDKGYLDYGTFQITKQEDPNLFFDKLKQFEYTTVIAESDNNSNSDSQNKAYYRFNDEANIKKYFEKVRSIQKLSDFKEVFFLPNTRDRRGNFDLIPRSSFIQLTDADLQVRKKVSFKFSPKLDFAVDIKINDQLKEKVASDFINSYPENTSSVKVDIDDSRFMRYSKELPILDDHNTVTIKLVNEVKFKIRIKEKNKGILKYASVDLTINNKPITKKTDEQGIIYYPIKLGHNYTVKVHTLNTEPQEQTIYVDRTKCNEYLEFNLTPIKNITPDKPVKKPIDKPNQSSNNLFGKNLILIGGGLVSIALLTFGIWYFFLKEDPVENWKISTKTKHKKIEKGYKNLLDKMENETEDVEKIKFINQKLSLSKLFNRSAIDKIENIKELRDTTLYLNNFKTYIQSIEANIDSLIALKSEIENQEQKSTPEIVKEPEEVKPKVDTKKERRKELIKMSEEALTQTSQIDNILPEIEENKCEFKEGEKKEIIERLEAYRELLNYIYRIEKNKTVKETADLQKNFQTNKALLSNAQVKHIEQKFENNGIKVE